MKRESIFFLVSTVLAALIFFGCAGKPKEVLLPWTGFEQKRYITLFEVVDYQGKEEGKAIPNWVHQYNYTDMRGMENLAEYYDSYVFVASNSGTQFSALQLWAQAWTVHQDFFLMVMERVQNRLINAIQSPADGSAPVYPDYQYGAFFEKAIKAVADAHYNNVLQGETFWQLKRYLQEDGITVEREAYEFLVLSSINKELLQKQIQAIFADLPPFTPPLTKDQETAVKKVTENFFTLF
ncbi:MAG: hypothetical protein LBB43_01775 [Spirochaetaceae bacterium]|jgi:hypothetical protein|nr:hypothetical protein [Spirochaetaceae bacterium]